MCTAGSVELFEEMRATGRVGRWDAAVGEVWKSLISSGWRLVRELESGSKYSWKNI